MECRGAVDLLLNGLLFSYSYYPSFQLPLILLFLCAHLTQFQSMNKRHVVSVSQMEIVRQRRKLSIARRASETSDDDGALSDARKGSRERQRETLHFAVLLLASPSAFSHFTLDTCFSQHSAILVFHCHDNHLLISQLVLSSIQCDFKCFNPTSQSCEKGN